MQTMGCYRNVVVPEVGSVGDWFHTLRRPWHCREVCVQHPAGWDSRVMGIDAEDATL
jgi:hypothetical protein